MIPFGARPYELPSWAIVAALREAERRTVRRPWLARLLGQRGPAGAGHSFQRAKCAAEGKRKGSET